MRSNFSLLFSIELDGGFVVQESHRVSFNNSSKSKLVAKAFATNAKSYSKLTTPSDIVIEYTPRRESHSNSKWPVSNYQNHLPAVAPAITLSKHITRYLCKLYRFLFSRDPLENHLL